MEYQWVIQDQLSKEIIEQVETPSQSTFPYTLHATSSCHSSGQEYNQDQKIRVVYNGSEMIIYMHYIILFPKF